MSLCRNSSSQWPLAAIIVAWTLVAPVLAGPTLTVDASRSAGPVGPLMYGLMTEEINHAYDGGLYAELVQNREFLDSPTQPAHWSIAKVDPSVATITLNPAVKLSDALPTSLRLDVTRGSAGVANTGYWGFPITPSTRYRASFYAKAAAGFDGPISLALQSDNGRVTFATAKVAGIGGEWKQYKAVLDTPADVAPTSHARYVVSVDRPGTLWLQLVSLFPPTWNDRPNGLRKDLMQMLVDLHPKFLRFPGGNFVEGGSVATRFQWKQTIGPLVDRPGHMSTWGYRATDGMGLLEFLEWCEDMRAEPVLAVFAGYTLDGKHIDAGSNLQPYVQEAIDEIEYVTGDAATTKWGARRAKDGHADPFPLRYVEVGNEDFFDKSGSYDARFAQFCDAIRTNYPQLKVISTVGNEQAKSMVHSRVPDAVDEHYYRPADEFIQLSPKYYENYDREKRPEIFVGEWASYEDAKIKPWEPAAKKLPPTPNFKAALGDAAWMTAIERNTDLVTMNCYAPLLVNVNPTAWQWRPDLIGYDAGHAFGSPSYYAIRMFSTHVGDQRLTSTVTDSAVQTSATRDSHSGDIYLKIVNPTSTEESLHVVLSGISFVAPKAGVVTLVADPAATNSITDPTQVVPRESTASNMRRVFDFRVRSNSISVITISPGRS